MKITVIDTDYVDLMSGTCMAEVGSDVLGLDMDPAKIKILEDRGMPIFEPDLQGMVKHSAAPGRLRFTTDVERAVHFGTEYEGVLDIENVCRGIRSNPRIEGDFLYSAAIGWSAMATDILQA